MAEYKDVTSLKKEIADFKKVVNSPNSDYMTGYICALSVTEGMIANLPDADVVEVVRCKDCKHWHKCLSDDGSVEYIHFSRCTKGNQLANGNDYFCSSGERTID